MIRNNFYNYLLATEEPNQFYAIKALGFRPNKIITAFLSGDDLLHSSVPVSYDILLRMPNDGEGLGEY